MDKAIGTRDSVNVIKEIGHKWYKNKTILFFLFVIGMLTAPFIFESIHIFWHGGSYQGYPIRFGYMVAFWSIVAGAYAVTNRQPILGNKRQTVLFVSVIACINIIGMFVIRYSAGRNITFLTILICLCMEVIVGVCIYIVSDRMRGWMLMICVLLHAATAISYSWIYSTDRMDNFLIRSVDISNQLEILSEEYTPLDRIRSKSIISNNYALAMRQSSMSSYLAVAQKEEQDFLRDLGYAVIGDRLSDYGGTAFSDMLLDIDYILSEEDENQDLYSFIAEVDGWKIYKCLYRYQTGILLDRMDDIIWKKERPFDNQNEIAREYFGRKLLRTFETNVNKITVKTEPNSVLYLYTRQMDQVRKIEIMNEDTGETQIKELHASGWDNGIQELGSWQGENVTIIVSGEEIISDLQVATLKLDTLEQIQPHYGVISDVTFMDNGMKIEFSSDEESYLYLPIYASKGWQCKVNGKKVNVGSVIKMLAIPVEKGDSTIELCYVSPGIRIGTLLSLLGIAVIIAEKLLLRRHLFILQQQFTALTIGIILLWSVMILLIYVGSVAGTLGFIIRSVI